MIKTVVREHHWAPDQVGALFISDDDDDINSLIYWYNDVCKCNDELKKKNK